MLYSPKPLINFGFLLGVSFMFASMPSTSLHANSTGQCFIGSRYLFGHLETVTRIDHQFNTNLTALIDSGSTTSSMDARNIKLESSNTGESWVRFNLLTKPNGPMITMFKPVKRFVYIQTHSGKPQRRPVIEATIELNNVKTTTEFSLTSRSKFPQSILLGRKTLDNIAVIDPSAKFVLQTCRSLAQVVLKEN